MDQILIEFHFLLILTVLDKKNKMFPNKDYQSQYKTLCSCHVMDKNHKNSTSRVSVDLEKPQSGPKIPITRLLFQKIKLL